MGRPERKGPLGRSSHEWEDITLDINEMGWEGMRRDSSIGIAIRCRMDGPGIEFSVPVQSGPGAHPTSYIVSTESLSRG